MSLIRRSRYWPFQLLDSFFDDFWELPDFTLMRIPEIRTPKLDIKEEDDHYNITAEIPGYTKEEVNVEINDGVLTISSEHKEEIEEENEGYFYKERSHRSFSRALRIPKHIKAEEIEAKMENGLLTLTIPKKEPIPPKKVEIKTAEEPDDTKPD
ncbi:MAG: Hsp20/alpha crystallin family protein [Candidatus Helarchaeota archaeon]